MAEDEKILPGEDSKKESEDLLDHIQMQVSGIPRAAIPKHMRLRPEDIDAGVQRFLRDHADDLDKR